MSLAPLDIRQSAIMQYKFIVPKPIPSRRVYGIGLVGSGSGALQKALRILGVKCIRAETINDVVLNEAAVGTPLPFLVDALDYFYNAKFIYTAIFPDDDQINNIQLWVKQGRPNALKRAYLMHFFGSLGPTHVEIQNGIYRYSSGLLEKFNHRPNDYLEMDLSNNTISAVKWDQLCDFLGKDIPYGNPFPRIERGDIY